MNEGRTAMAKFEVLSRVDAFGAWTTMTARVQAENSPNLVLMSTDAGRSRVTDLIVVPRRFLTPEMIERRKPLAPTARRAG